MTAFRVTEDATGTTEARWLETFRRRAVPELRLPVAAEEVVVVSAHPDDDVLAVGDLLRTLHRAGASIRSIVATDGERSHPASASISSDELGSIRRREMRDAYEVLGIDAPITWLGIGDGEVAGSEEHARDEIGSAIGPVTLVIAPWRLDGHPDHDAVGRAASDAASAAGATLWEFPVWAWHWADPLAECFPWSRVQRWACDGLAAKRRAIDCFDSQVRSDIAWRPDGPVLPPAVLERFHRPFEVVFT